MTYRGTLQSRCKCHKKRVVPNGIHNFTPILLSHQLSRGLCPGERLPKLPRNAVRVISFIPVSWTKVLKWTISQAANQQIVGGSDAIAAKSIDSAPDSCSSYVSCVGCFLPIPVSTWKLVLVCQHMLSRNSRQCPGVAARVKLLLVHIEKVSMPWQKLSDVVDFRILLVRVPCGIEEQDALWASRNVCTQVKSSYRVVFNPIFDGLVAKQLTYTSLSQYLRFWSMSKSWTSIVVWITLAL